MELRVAKSGDFLKPIIEFASDAHGAEEDLKEKDTQPRRRAYIRALFAMIEGSMYFLKQTCLSASLRSGNPGRLSVGELAILDERTFDLSPNGTVTDQPKFLRTLANVRFLHLMLGRVFQMSLDLGVGTQRWEEFSQAITVRNRITHPKSLGEFEISDEELAIMNRLSDWFTDFLAHSFQSIMATITQGKEGCRLDADFIDNRP